MRELSLCCRDGDELLHPAVPRAWCWQALTGCLWWLPSSLQQTRRCLVLGWGYVTAAAAPVPRESCWDGEVRGCMSVSSFASP